jgi:hypothetical protein
VRTGRTAPIVTAGAERSGREHNRRDRVIPATSKTTIPALGTGLLIPTQVVRNRAMLRSGDRQPVEIPVIQPQPPVSRRALLRGFAVRLEAGRDQLQGHVLRPSYERRAGITADRGWNTVPAVLPCGAGERPLASGSKPKTLRLLPILMPRQWAPAVRCRQIVEHRPGVTRHRCATR